MLDIHIYKNLRKAFTSVDAEEGRRAFIKALNDAKQLCLNNGLRIEAKLHPEVNELPIVIRGISRLNADVARLVESSLCQALGHLRELDTWNIHRFTIVSALTIPGPIQGGEVEQFIDGGEAGQWNGMRSWLNDVRGVLGQNNGENDNARIFNDTTAQDKYSIVSNYTLEKIKKMQVVPADMGLDARLPEGVQVQDLMHSPNDRVGMRQASIENAIRAYEEDYSVNQGDGNGWRYQTRVVGPDEGEKVIYKSNARLASDTVTAMVPIIAAIQKNKTIPEACNDFYFNSLDTVNNANYSTSPSDMLEALLYAKTENKPAFFGVSNNRHWVTAGLLPDPTDNGKLIPVRMDSNAAIYSNLGNSELKKMKETGQKLGIDIDIKTTDLSFGQQVDECCGLATSLNIGVLAQFHDDVTNHRLPRKFLEKNDINPDNFHRISRPEEQIHLQELLKKVFPIYISFDPYGIYRGNQYEYTRYTENVGSRVLTAINEVNKRINDINAINMGIYENKIPKGSVHIIRELERLLYRDQGQLPIQKDELIKVGMIIDMLPPKAREIYKADYDQVMATCQVEREALGVNNRLYKLLTGRDGERIKALLSKAIYNYDHDQAAQNADGQNQQLRFDGDAAVAQMHPQVTKLLLDTAFEIRDRAICYGDQTIFGDIGDLMKTVWEFFLYMLNSIILREYKTGSVLKTEISEALQEIYDLVPLMIGEERAPMNNEDHFRKSFVEVACQKRKIIDGGLDIS